MGGPTLMGQGAQIRIDKTALSSLPLQCPGYSGAALACPHRFLISPWSSPTDSPHLVQRTRAGQKIVGACTYRVFSC